MKQNQTFLHKTFKSDVIFFSYNQSISMNYKIEISQYYDQSETEK